MNEFKKNEFINIQTQKFVCQYAFFPATQYLNPTDSFVAT